MPQTIISTQIIEYYAHVMLEEKKGVTSAKKKKSNIFTNDDCQCRKLILTICVIRINKNV